ncbi:hypothetical protein QAD02_004993 [Eretmocerus hayati]|uniref:Uncharacterized protein n=1 Tax=Eretmocerus hayati TaxID=131215 RepID=A0ACC2NRH0_9HYME|nr:hypothetical protein QAD02_004993 [Eretmocerus hayati]
MEKTPVTLLNEMMAKIGCTPLYELCPEEMNRVPKIFKFQVSCQGIVTEGCGRSKKEAKHDAASKMLDKLKRGKVVSQSCPDTRPCPQFSNHFKKPGFEPVRSESPVDISSIKDLESMCKGYSFDTPVYVEMTTPYEPGLPENFQMQCRVSTVSVVGRGLSREIAKCQAAKNMIQRLKEIFCIENTSSEFKNMKIDRSNGSRDENQNTFRNDAPNGHDEIHIHHEKIAKSNFPVPRKQLSQLSPHLSSKFRYVYSLVENCPQDFPKEEIDTIKEALTALLDAAKIDFNHMLLQTTDPPTYMLIMQLNTVPDILEMSLGNTREEVELRTIRKIIDSLGVHFD